MPNRCHRSAADAHKKSPTSQHRADPIVTSRMLQTHQQRRQRWAVTCKSAEGQSWNRTCESHGSFLKTPDNKQAYRCDTAASARFAGRANILLLCAVIENGQPSRKCEFAHAGALRPGGRWPNFRTNN